MYEGVHSRPDIKVEIADQCLSWFEKVIDGCNLERDLCQPHHPLRCSSIHFILLCRDESRFK